MEERINSESGYVGHEHVSFHREGVSMTPEQCTALLKKHIPQLEIVSPSAAASAVVVGEQEEAVLPKVRLIARGFNNVCYEVSGVSKYKLAEGEAVPFFLSPVTPVKEEGDDSLLYNFRLAVRLSSNKTWPKEKLQYEVASLKFLSSSSSAKLPVPRVLFSTDFDHPEEDSAISKNAWSCIGMEWMEGTVLAKNSWNALSKEKQVQLVREIVDAVEQLQSFCGPVEGLVVDSSSPSAAKALQPPIGAVAGYNSATSAPLIGKFFDAAETIAEGPYASCSEWLEATLSHYANRNKQFLETVPAVQKLLAFEDRLWTLLRERVIPEAQVDTSIPIVPVHGDLCGRNILIHTTPASPSSAVDDAPSSSTVLSAIVDWEWLAFKPAPLEFLHGFDDVEDDFNELLAEELGRRQKGEAEPQTENGASVLAAARKYYPTLQRAEGTSSATVRLNHQPHLLMHFMDAMDAFSPWELQAHVTAGHAVAPSVEEMIDGSVKLMEKALQSAL